MLNIDHLQKHYKDFMLDVTMEVRPGCVTGLVGRNGAGKSTTFKSVLDLVCPDSGKIQIFGRDSRQLTEKDRQKMGVVLSDSGFSDYLTVKDVHSLLRRMYESYDEGYFLSQCERQGLPMNKKIKEFSTGMKAKLKLVVALSHQAKLLILDEPTLGLDVAMREELLDLLRTYMAADEERSILISSHIATDLESLCDDIYLIHDGSIVLHEDTDVLLSSYAVLKMDEGQYESIDKKYVIKSKKDAFGYSCLTNQKRFYLDNYPQLVIEQSGIDDLILFMIGGE